MADTLGDEIFVHRGPTEYEENGVVHQIDYGGYQLVTVDRDAIPDEDLPLETLLNTLLESSQYTSLLGKTQVLNSGVENPSIGVTNRLFHDMQVSQNAMKIARALGGNFRDILIAQIGGIGHDLGHTPFGHDGEVALSDAIKTIVPGAYFSHSEYGESIIDTMIGDVLKALSEGEMDFDIDSKESIRVIEGAREEIGRAVKNHSQYYQSKASVDGKQESIGEKSVRLADTLSFMVSDLSDLMRGEDATKPGQRILPKERMIEEIQSLEGLTDRQKEEMIALVEPLYQGGDALRGIHEKLVEETFDPQRSILREGEQTTILDDIKFLYDIESKAAAIEKTNSAVASVDAFVAIGEYYSYITQSITEDTNELRKNIVFRRRVQELLGEDDEKVAFERITSVLKKVKGKSFSENSILTSSDLTIEDLELIETITSDLTREDEEGRNLREISKLTADSIVSKEMESAPTLLTLYTLQNKIQYGEILATEEGKKSLGNDTFELEDGSTMSPSEMIKVRFGTIYEMARIIQTGADKYGETDEARSPLSTYRNMTVPPFYYMKDGQRVSDPALSYAVFAVQQMQNSDFANEEIMIEISDSLGFSQEGYETIKAEVELREMARRKSQKAIEEKMSHSNSTSTISLKSMISYLKENELNINDDSYKKYVGNSLKNDERINNIKSFYPSDIVDTIENDSSLPKSIFERMARAFRDRFLQRNNRKDFTGFEDITNEMSPDYYNNDKNYNNYNDDDFTI